MMNIDSLFNTIASREKSVGWESLSPPERTVATVMLLWYEVGNGGLHQYFFNSTGDLATSAPDSFISIGAEETASVVRRANFLFGPEGPNKDREARQAQLEAFSQLALDTLDELDQYICEDPEDLETLISTYAQSNGLKG